MACNILVTISVVQWLNTSTRDFISLFDTMTNKDESLDVPEEPDVDPPEDDTPSMPAISFFTAAR